MPVILRFNGIDLFFYSNEHRPIHRHIKKGDAYAKIQIEGGVEILEAREFNPATLKRLKKFCTAHAGKIIEAWEDYFYD